MYHGIIRKGTVIRIGKQPSLDESAVGLEFRLSKDIRVSDGRAHGVKSKVVKNPNGWEYDEVHYGYDHRYDTIVRPENRFNKDVLERYDT